jgi:murein DD-endopeptidase MepM/ murein hydrolase activator NlpD
VSRFIALILVALTLFQGNVALAQPLPTESISVQSSSGKPEIGHMPGISAITFNNQRFSQPGNFVMPDQGGAPQRLSWQRGQSLAELLTLGDVGPSTGLPRLSLPAIAQLGGISSPENLPLTREPIILNQRLPDLANMGEFNNIPVSRIPALNQALENLRLKPGYQDQTLSQVYQQNPEQLNQATLGSALGPAAQQFTMSAISPLLNVATNQFSNWASQRLSQVPGAGDIPLGSMPQQNAAISQLLARIDFVWGNVERRRNRTVSGSDNVGFRFQCQGNCASVELDDLEAMGAPTSPLEGAHWIGGQQMVPGGRGPLKAVGGGMEPTGRILDKEGLIKMVLFPNEKTDMVSMGLFYRKCGPPSCQANATPYIFGPTSVITYRVNSLIPMGANFDQEMMSAVANPGNIPANPPMGGNLASGGNPLNSALQAAAGAAPGLVQGNNNCTTENTLTSLADAATETENSMGLPIGGSSPPPLFPKPASLPTGDSNVSSYLPGGQSAAPARYRDQFLSAANSAVRQINPQTNLPYQDTSLVTQTAGLGAGGPAINPAQVTLPDGQPLQNYSEAVTRRFEQNNPCNLGQSLRLASNMAKPGTPLPNNGAPLRGTAKCLDGINSCPLQNPLPEMSSAGIYSGFRRPSRPNHNGIDIQSRTAQAKATNNPSIPGGSVLAAALGVVLYAENGNNGGLGNFVQVSHPQYGIQTEYAHLFQIQPEVKPGRTVTRGGQIGIEGTTGRSQGIHLHYQVREQGLLVNPANFPHTPPFNCTVPGGCR